MSDSELSAVWQASQTRLAEYGAGPGSGGTTPRSGQLDNEIIFLCEDDEDDANEASPTIQFIFSEDDTNEA